MMTICIQLLQQQLPTDNPAYEDILYAIGTLAGCTLQVGHANSSPRIILPRLCENFDAVYLRRS